MTSVALTKFSNGVCGRQSSKMVPKVTTYGVHALNNPFSLSVGQTCEEDGVGFHCEVAKRDFA
jgi:hypothetical protein